MQDSTPISHYILFETIRGVMMDICGSIGFGFDADSCSSGMLGLIRFFVFDVPRPKDVTLEF